MGRLDVKRYYKLNYQITVPQVRVISEEGKQIGLLSIAEAQRKAQDLGLDLVEIAPDAKPPVVKIIEFKKFKYLEEKKEKEARKHAKATELKEVRFTPFIGEHDLKVGLQKAKKFLDSGDLVKISIRFKGAQMAHQEFGPKLLARILENLQGISQEERPARFEGRQYVTIIKPVKVHKESNQDSKKEISNDQTKN